MWVLLGHSIGIHAHTLTLIPVFFSLIVSDIAYRFFLVLISDVTTHNLHNCIDTYLEYLIPYLTFGINI